MASLGENAAERYLVRQLLVQRETMQRRGVAADGVDLYVNELEMAIRAQLWHALIAPGGAE